MPTSGPRSWLVDRLDKRMRTVIHIDDAGKIFDFGQAATNSASWPLNTYYARTHTPLLKFLCLLQALMSRHARPAIRVHIIAVTVMMHEEISTVTIECTYSPLKSCS